MLKQLAIILCLVSFVGGYTLAQDEPKVQQQESAAWNSVCPVDGEPVSADVETIKHNGKAYGFDKPSCAAVFNDDPEAYVGNLNEDGTEFTGKKGEIKEEEE